MIDTPEDLKKLNLHELEQLAEEMRSRIIEVVSVNGGHLASNLGSVELIIALHKVFSSPDDKFIFDVSHQSYPHKLLTGRNARFETLRKTKGICGFSDPKESPHDHFYAGHAGTAVSLSLGVAKARDLKGGTNHVIPFIGDASLTCGLTYEALNNISKTMGRYILVLNDNAMSISNNVGAITSILSRIINSPTSNKIYNGLEHLAAQIPKCGPKLARQGQRLTESIKNLVSPAVFFEHFGLSYVGPVDGHNLKELIDLFTTLKDNPRPFIVHALTHKGKGMSVAMQSPCTYHGAKPFDKVTGEFHPTSNRPTFPKIFGQEMMKLAASDPSIVVITPAMSAGSCIDPLMESIPERTIDVGIAEGHAVTYCGALAKSGQKVICSIYSTFLQRAFDNLFHDVCLQEAPVVFAIDRGGLSAADGSTHHGVYDISFLNAMPNMVISQPRNGQLLAELIDSSFSWERPAAIRYPNMETDGPSKELKTRPMGQGEVLIQGKELLIIALGHMVNTARQVRDKLLQDGIEATILDPIFIKPLDTDLLVTLLMTHNQIVTIEEHSVVCGLGAIINNFLMTNGFSNLSVLNFGIPETFVSHGSYADLIKECGLTAEQITKRILSTFAHSHAMIS